MVWLKSPKSQLSKTFSGLENLLRNKEGMSQNVCVCSFPIFDISNINSITALRCTWSISDIFNIFDIHSITVLRCIWCIFDIFDIFDIHNITALRFIWSIFDIFDMSHTLYSVQITMKIVIQCLQITVKFDLNPWFTLNYNRVRTKTLNYRHFELAKS